MTASLSTSANMSDYDATRRSFRWDGRTNFNFGSDVVDDWAPRAPDDEALFWVEAGGLEQHVTYAALALL